MSSRVVRDLKPTEGNERKGGEQPSVARSTIAEGAIEKGGDSKKSSRHEVRKNRRQG